MHRFGQGGENIQAAALNPVNAFKNMPGFGSGDTAIAAGAWAVEIMTGELSRNVSMVSG